MVAPSPPRLPRAEKVKIRSSSLTRRRWRPLKQRLTEESDILTALDNHQFAIWLQPQVEMRSGNVLSAEALLRMQQPDGSWELPEGLIERIESCGLMVTVGYWVLEESCRQLAAWQERGVTLPLSVNLSALQLMHPGMVSDLLELLNRYPYSTGYADS
ncbi:Protein yhjK [Salmonella enterica subsp. enterica serovar Typhimurium]|nr:Protein yhjK [Salmonella enterica subsp. enterica serovar Typhimurium]